MVVIGEWLPNPAGSDAAGEWIELVNTGGAAVPLSGWMLKTGNGKQYRIGDSVIAPYGYLVFPRAATKLTLRNTGEELFLYDNSGTLVDKSRFLGSAPEDRSVSRFGETFSFAIPTPGGANRGRRRPTLGMDA